MIVRIARVKVGYRQAVIKLSPLRILSGLFAFQASYYQSHRLIKPATFPLAGGLYE
jgi:hypothetical protein